MTSMRTIWFCVILMIPTIVQADWEQTLYAALDEAALDHHQQFAFKQTVISKKNGIEVSIFQPDVQPQWQLISLDGEPPSEKDKRKFQKDKRKRAEDGTLADLIKPGSVQVKSETTEQVVLTFQPSLRDFPEKAVSAIVGTVVWNLSEHRLSAIHIYNTEPFSPALSVKIRDMNMEFLFTEVDGFTLPQHIRFAFQGQFAGIKTFNVDSTIAYSDFH